MSLKSIRKRLEEATPGPWQATVVTGDSAYYSNPGSNIHLNDMVAWPVGPLSKSSTRASKDAALIAHAPSDIANLLVIAEVAERLLRMPVHLPEDEWYQIVKALHMLDRDE